MKRKLTTPMLASIGAMGLVCALFLSFYLSTGAYRSGGTGIVLPSESQKDAVTGTLDGAADAQITSAVAIKPDTVQKVIATLKRPATYSSTVKSTISAGERSRTTEYRQTVTQDLCRTDELNTAGGIVRTVLRSQDRLYAWSAGDSSYTSMQNGAFSNDSAAMLPSYETVIKLPTSQISAAQLVNINYEPCIHVTANDSKYRMVYDISTISGLLLRAEIYEGNVPIRTCEVMLGSTEKPQESVFTLPDGTKLVK